MKTEIFHDVASPGSHFNFAAHLLSVNTKRANKTAFIADNGQLTYAELQQQIQTFAKLLQTLSISAEQRVVLLMHDQLQWPVTFLGAIYAGIVPVALNTLLSVQDYAYMIEHSQARMIVVNDALLPTVRNALQGITHCVKNVLVVRSAQSSVLLGSGELDWNEQMTSCKPLTQCANSHADAPAFWLYSSGSTGKPKAAVHTNANLYWTAELYGRRSLGIVESDTVFSAAKLFFAYGLGNSLSFPLSVGATAVLMAERPTPAAIFDRLIKNKVTVFYGAPTGYASMLASKDLPVKSQVHLRICSSAGEALPQELGINFEKHFNCPIIDGLGSTEMLHIFLANTPADYCYGTSGKVVPGYDIKLLDENGTQVAQGEIGELWVRGPSAALMYWNDRDRSQTTFQGAWVKSGDKYLQQADGNLVYCGRSDDMIKVSGIFVSPFEVEATLMKHQSVLEVAVVGVKDADGLVKTKAYVVLKTDQHVNEDELKHFCKEHLAAYKYPRSIVFIKELPKTATGKIQRFRLRELG